jgi:hypothetical protein
MIGEIIKIDYIRDDKNKHRLNYISNLDFETVSVIPKKDKNGYYRIFKGNKIYYQVYPLLEL